MPPVNLTSSETPYFKIVVSGGICVVHDTLKRRCCPTLPRSATAMIVTVGGPPPRTPCDATCAVACAAVAHVAKNASNNLTSHLFIIALVILASTENNHVVTNLFVT